MPRIILLALLVLLISGSTAVSSMPTSPVAPIEVVASGFGSLRGIVVDDDDRVYVADREAGAITRLGPDGRRVVARRLERPIGLALDPGGRVLVAEERGGRIVRLDPTGPTTIGRGIKQPRWLAVSEDGTVYVSARRLGRDADPEPDDESLEPEVILALNTDGTLSVFADGFDHLQGIAVQGDALYAATTGRRGPPRQVGVIYRIPIQSDGRAGPPARVGIRDVLERPVGLAVDRLGALYLGAPVTNLGGSRVRQAVLKLQQDGAASLFSTGLDSPRGLAFDRYGHLYVADGGRVMRFLAPDPPSLAPVSPFTTHPALALSGAATRDARIDVRDDDAAVSSTLTGGSGTFALTVPLTAGAEHQLAVYATAARGVGLTSRATEARIVRDAVVPSIALVAPASGAFVRGVVSIRADATDPLAGVALLSLSVGTQSLGAVVTPALPAASANAVATWTTTAIPDGTYTLTATASDRAGNVATVTRVLLVDNTPPEVTILEQAPTVEPGGTTIAWQGRDNIAPASGLQFAWRLDGGQLGPFTSATTVTLPQLAPGPHRFEVIARDPAGNETAAPATRTFTTGGLTLTLTEPADEAVIDGDVVLVSGTVDAGGAWPAINVNGRPALVHGTRWAAQVPVTPGSQTLVATATTGDGQRAIASRTITALSPSATVQLRAEPGEGLAPLHVVWRVMARGTRPLVRFELDRLGTGVFEPPIRQLDGADSTYVGVGLWTPTVRAIDDEGRVYLARTVLRVDDAEAAAQRFQGLWADFIARLAAGDHSGVRSLLVPRLHDRLALVADRLGSDLAHVVAGLPPIDLIDQVDHLAEAALVQVEDGVARLYFVYFRRDNLGRWLIDEM